MGSQPHWIVPGMQELLLVESGLGGMVGSWPGPEDCADTERWEREWERKRRKKTMLGLGTLVQSKALSLGDEMLLCVGFLSAL